LSCMHMWAMIMMAASWPVASRVLAPLSLRTLER
jgi:hypothetical protein